MWSPLRGIATDLSKTPNELRGFFGLTEYYQKFVKVYITIAWPLIEQWNKDSFQWGNTATQAFEKLKQAMSNVPIFTWNGKQDSECSVKMGGSLQPLALPGQVWEEVTLDFIDWLPRSDRFIVILAVVNRLSKYEHFIPLYYPYTAVTIVVAFVRKVVWLHGISESIVTDWDKSQSFLESYSSYKSQCWKEA